MKGRTTRHVTVCLIAAIALLSCLPAIAAASLTNLR